jgi:lipoate-protein ligase A
MNNDCRLLPYEVAAGAWNMAADELLLQAARSGRAALRFYGWSAATLSLGYFQPARARLAGERLASLPWVRRATGGLILVHHHELTYALAVPAEPPWRGSDWRGWQAKMHALIAAALGDFDIKVAAAPSLSAGQPSDHEALCFLAPTPGDLLVDTAKVVGSAQRRQRGALLQHGAVLLAGSAHAPELPGLRELTGRTIAPEALAEAIAARVAVSTGWALSPSSWSDEERCLIEALIVERYGNPAWQDKR